MEWAVDIIEPDEEGIQFYLSCYKPFRLLSLQLSPESFSSTYARESAFDEHVWMSRILRPTATTFVATSTTRDDTNGKRRVVSSLTLIAAEANSLAESSGPMRWEMNAVYTLPEARRRGVASAVLASARDFARAEAEARRRDWVLTAVVRSSNAGGAQALYEKAGFKVQSLVGDGTEMVLGSPTSIFSIPAKTTTPAC